MGRIAYKAGLVDEKTGARRYTAYCLRHTAANMWRAIGIDLEDLRALMSHEKIDTTSGHYLHEAPHLAVLRREVAELGLEKTREGLIDGLGIVLAQRWREAGLDIPCSPPRSASLPEQARLPNYHDEGKVIDMTPDRGDDGRAGVAGDPNARRLEGVAGPGDQEAAGTGPHEAADLR